MKPNFFSRSPSWPQLLVPALLLVLAACSTTPQRFNTSYAAGYYASEPMQCVPYARQASGVRIFGDAHTWWDQAGNAYQRGYMPRKGAVLVLARTQRMRHGHLAVVTHLVNPRQVDVTHSNWGNNRQTRRVIYERMRAEDVSPMNDWSSVRFWNHHIGAFGQPYKALGFIYP